MITAQTPPAASRRSSGRLSPAVDFHAMQMSSWYYWTGRRQINSVSGESPVPANQLSWQRM